MRAREQTGGAIRALLNLAPKTARRVRDDGNDEEVPLEQVQIGDRLRVRPGDSVPVDGIVVEGRSAVDESMVTGELMPVEKEPGAKVIGGTINGTGSLVMRAEKVGSDTMLARIVHMVAEAQRSRAPIQRLADTVSGWFVPVGDPRRGRRVHRLDDLWTAARFRLRAGGRRVRRHHRLPLRARPGDADVDHGRRRQGRDRGRPDQERRGAGALRKDRHARRRQDRNADRRQAAASSPSRPPRVSTKPRCCRLRAGLERSSEHPLAAAIVASAKERGLALGDVADFASVTGKGVTGKIGGRQVAIGNAGLLEDLGVAGADLEPRADRLRREGATVMFMAVDGTACRPYRRRRSGQGDHAGCA